MTSLSTANTILRSVPVYAEDPVVVLSKEVLTKEDENDDDTIRVAEEPASAMIDTSIFDVFTEFDLDLSCLSRPASPEPEPSTSYLSHATPSPPVSPILSRSMSFASSAQSPVPTQSLGLKKWKKASSPQLSATAPTGTRGSWPLIKYAGRGTPINRNRRLEWAGLPSDEAAEDGVLFSAARSTSLDSNVIRPSQRSLSPDWHHSSNMSSSLSHSTHSEALTQKTEPLHEPPPALAPVEALGLNEAEEWDSIMRTVLSPTRELEPTTPTGTNEADENLKEEPSINNGVTNETPKSKFEAQARLSAPGPDLARKEGGPMLPVMTPEQIEQMNNGLEIDLGIDAALDLGLGRGSGMNWFDLGLLPASASARESISVYSQAATPTQASPPVSLRGSRRSTTSTKANRDGTHVEAKSAGPRWWQKMLTRIRQVHNVITIHKN